MIHKTWLGAAVCALIAGIAVSNDKLLNQPAEDLTALHGFWKGSWGGGMSADGVVFQPVLAELYIGKESASWHGLPMPNGDGTVQLQSDGKGRWMRFTFAAKEKGKPPEKPVDVSYTVKGDQLTLKIGEKRAPVSLTRIAVLQTLFADMNVAFETARGIDRDGNLLTTTVNALKVGERGPELPAPTRMVRPLENARIYRIEEHGAPQISIDEVRKLLRTQTPVVVATRGTRRPHPSRDFGLSKRFPSLQPDSEAGLKTLTHLFKPGTLVFVVPEAERSLPP